MLPGIILGRSNRKKQSGWLSPDERRDSAMYSVIGFILSILNEYNREIIEIFQYLCRKITA